MTRGTLLVSHALVGLGITHALAMAKEQGIDFTASEVEAARNCSREGGLFEVRKEPGQAAKRREERWKARNRGATR